MFHSMKVQRTKMLATDPNLESNVMIFQGIEKMLFPILYMFHYPLGGSGHVAKVRKQVSATQERPVQDSRSLRTDKGVGGGALTCSKRRECAQGQPLAMHQSPQPVCRWLHAAPGSVTVHTCFMLGFERPGIDAPPEDHACMHAKSLQSCPTLCDLVDCSPPGSSVHGLLQARILEGVAVSPCRRGHSIHFSRGSSRPRD